MSMKPFGNMIDERVRLTASATEVFREITPEWREFYGRLWREGVIGRLCQKGFLLESVAVNQEPDQVAQLCFRQPRIPFVAYPHEWTAAMFREAAEECLNLHETLFESNLCLTDSHPWNFVFHGHDPQWVDLTSLNAFEARPVETALRQFRSFFLNPLTLLCEGQEPVARALLAHAFADVPDAQADSILRSGEWQVRPWHRRLPHALLAVQAQSFRMLGRALRRHLEFNRVDFTSPAAAIRVVRSLRRELASIRPDPMRQEWTAYVQAGQEPLGPQEAADGRIEPRRLENSKVRVLDTWLTRLKSDSRSLLDLGCNKGLFAQMASLQGYVAAGIDTDQGAVDGFYQSSRTMRLPVYCAVNDFVAPREAMGMLTNPLPGFAQRFQADVALCFAVVHHLYFGRYKMSFDRIMQLLGLYARRHLIVEFVPPDDVYLRGHYAVTERTDGYTREEFSRAVSQCFRVLEVGPSFPAGREIWILQKN